MTALKLAHRGDWRAAPENTIAAFVAAMRVPGCDGFELDVRASADGVPVVIHDATLERVQRVDLRADELMATELSARGVPTLAAVFAALGDGPFVDVELKEWLPGVIGVLEAARGTGLARAAVSSFHAEILRDVATARPAWPRWLNTVGLDAGVVGLAVELGCTGVGAQWRSITLDTVQLVAEAHVELIGWTVRGRATYRRLERLGVFGICAEAAALDG